MRRPAVAGTGGSAGRGRWQPGRRVHPAGRGGRQGRDRGDSCAALSARTSRPATGRRKSLAKAAQHTQGERQAQHAQQRRQRDQPCHVWPVVAHARRQHVATGRRGYGRKGQEHGRLHRVETEQQRQAEGHQRHRQVLDGQHRHGQGLGRCHAAELHAGARRHEAQRQRGLADAVHRGREPVGQGEAQQVGHQAGGGGDDQRVAQQLAPEALVGVACHGPHRAHVEDGHAAADDHRHHQQRLWAGHAVGQRQQDEGVETEPHLRTGRVQAHVDVAAQPGPVRQRVGEGDGAQGQRNGRTHQAGGRAQVQRVLHDALEQQHREQEVVDEALDLLPHRAVELGEAAHQVAAQDEREVGKEQLGEVHRPIVRAGRGLSATVSARRPSSR